MLVAIVAKARNGAIGKDNQMPWHLPEDLKFFKETTWDHVIIMGRKTLESLPKLLPHREHWVITRNADYVPPYEGVRVFASLEEVYAAIAERTGKDGHPIGGEEPFYIIGGGELFQQSMGDVDKAFITRVDADIEGDVFLDELDGALFECVAVTDPRTVEAYPWTYTFETWERKDSNKE